MFFLLYRWALGLSSLVAIFLWLLSPEAMADVHGYAPVTGVFIGNLAAALIGVDEPIKRFEDPSSVVAPLWCGINAAMLVYVIGLAPTFTVMSGQISVVLGFLYLLWLMFGARSQEVAPNNPAVDSSGTVEEPSITFCWWSIRWYAIVVGISMVLIWWDPITRQDWPMTVAVVLNLSTMTHLLMAQEQKTYNWGWRLCLLAWVGMVLAYWFVPLVVLLTSQLAVYHFMIFISLVVGLLQLMMTYSYQVKVQVDT